MENLKHNSEQNYSLWGGRFRDESDELMKRFNSSLPIDKRLWKQDIKVDTLINFI